MSTNSQTSLRGWEAASILRRCVEAKARSSEVIQNQPGVSLELKTEETTNWGNQAILEDIGIGNRSIWEVFPSTKGSKKNVIVVQNDVCCVIVDQEILDTWPDALIGSAVVN